VGIDHRQSCRRIAGGGKPATLLRYPYGYCKKPDQRHGEYAIEQRHRTAGREKPPKVLRLDAQQSCDAPNLDRIAKGIEVRRTMAAVSLISTAQETVLIGVVVVLRPTA